MAWHTVPRSHCTAPVPCLPMATTSPWRPGGAAYSAARSFHGAPMAWHTVPRSHCTAPVPCLPTATTSPWRPDGVAHGATRSLHGAGKCLLTVPACRGSETDEMTRRRSRHAMTRGRRIAFRQSRMYQRYLRKRWHRSVAPMPCRQKYRPCAIA